jgi:hypothetical protein
MDCNEILKTLGVVGISAGSVTAVIIFLGKKYIELLSQKKLEEAKNDLLKQAAEFQIKASKLHSERLEAIKELYSNLSELNDSVFILVVAGQGNKSEETQIDKFYQKYYDLRIEFNKNKILFNKDLSILIDRTLQKIHSSLFNFKKIVETTAQIENEVDDELVKYYRLSKREDWDRAAKLIEIEVPILLEKLEDEFREILGVK